MPEPVTAAVWKVVKGLFRRLTAKPRPEVVEVVRTGPPEDVGQPVDDSGRTTTVSQAGHVANQISGPVNGRVIQAGDVHGGVRY
jgi:hypothetical protein